MKIKALVVLLLIINSSLVFAAPINNLEEGQAVLGIMMQGGDFKNSFFGETQVGDSIIVGLQIANYSNSLNVSDFYVQYKLDSALDSMMDNPVRIILGNKTYDSRGGLYIGAGISTPLSEELDGYGSATFGSGFQDYQVGVNYNLSDNAIVNLNYRVFNYEKTINGAGLGIMCKF